MLRANRLSKSFIATFILLAVAVAFNDTLAEVKPGDVITENNWEKVKDIAPISVLNQLKKGNFTLKIVDDPLERPLLLPKEYWEATKKYSSSVKLGADGSLINYVAGFPFGVTIDPKDTQAGLKVGWNLYRRWWGDDLTYKVIPGKGFGVNVTPASVDNVCRRWCIDKHGREIISDIMSWSFRTTGRVRLDPKPVITGCEDIEWLACYRTLSPRDVAGTASLEVRYWDTKKGDDFWLYIPSIRRVRRLPTNARASTRAPADYSWDDSGAFRGKVPLFDWKLLGEGKRIIPWIKHVPMVRKKGFYLPQDEKWAVHDCWIVAHTPKDPNYQIPKRVFYLDKATFLILDWYIYDRKGELWKSLTSPILRYVNEKGEEVDGTAGVWNCDYQTGHSTQIDVMGLTLDSGLSRDSFTVTNILRVSKGQQAFR